MDKTMKGTVLTLKWMIEACHDEVLGACVSGKLDSKTKEEGERYAELYNVLADVMDSYLKVVKTVLIDE